MIRPKFNYVQIFTKRTTVTVHPVTGEKPPALEEFDPLNPGNWQIGVGDKILPRLPEGTRCGKLVMGKYGLYDPKSKKLAEYMQRCHAAGIGTEDCFVVVRQIRYFLSFLLVFVITPISFFSVYCMIHQKLYWPYTLFEENE